MTCRAATVLSLRSTTTRFCFQAPITSLRARPNCRMMAATSGKVGSAELLQVAERAALAGAQVILAALGKPKQVSNKQGTDIVTETDEASEVACVSVLQQAFPAHAILAEEKGLLGDSHSDYLWCIDPLDGTANFSHEYPCFSVSVGVLRHSLPVAGVVVEVTGVPGAWSTRTYAAARNQGATCDGRPMSVSSCKDLSAALVACEGVFTDEDSWNAHMELYDFFGRTTRGWRRTGSAAVTLCHVALGVVDAYYQYNLKPWDVAAGVLIVEEAGGRVTTMDGTAFSIFDRSMLATNDAIYSKVLDKTEPVTQRLHDNGVDLSPWHVPKGYGVRSGRQLD